MNNLSRSLYRSRTDLCQSGIINGGDLTMRMIKKAIAVMLAATLLIGMPISIKAVAPSAELVITDVAILDDQKLVFTFSEEVAWSGSLNIGIGLFSGSAGEGLRRYYYDEAKDTYVGTNTSTVGATAEGTSYKVLGRASWVVSGIGYYNNRKDQVVGTIAKHHLSGYGTQMTYSDIAQVAATSPDHRFVAYIGDNEATDDGYVDTFKSFDGSKKLKAPVFVADQRDTAEFPMATGVNLVAARLYASDHAVLQFSTQMQVPEYCDVTYALYKNGVRNESAGVWRVESLNVFRGDRTKLVGHLVSDTNGSLWEQSAQLSDHTIGVTIRSRLNKNNVIEELIAVSGTPLLATDSVSEDTAYVAVSRRESEKLFTIDRVVVTSDTTFVLDFSEEVDLTNAKFGAWVEIRNTNNQMTWYKANGSGYDVEYRASSGRTGWSISQWGTSKYNYYNGNRDQVEFTTYSYVDMEKIYNADSNGNYLVVRMTDPYPHLTDTVSNNNKVDTVKSVSGLKLDANFGGAEDCATPIVSGRPQLLGVTLYQSGQLAITANHPLKNSLNEVNFRLGLYKDGHLDTGKVNWMVDVSASNWYGDYNTLLMNTDAADIAKVLADNPEHELGVMIVSNTSGTDGKISEMQDTAGYGLYANRVYDGKDAAYASVVYCEESLFSIQSVEPHQEKDLLITFSEEAQCVVGTKQWVGISLYKNGGLLRYRKNTRTNEYEFATAAQVTQLGASEGEWHHAQWYTTLKHYEFANRKDQMLAKIDGDWTYSQLMEFADKADAELIFRIQESDSNVGYNGTVESMAALDDEGNKLLATTFEANEQFRWSIYTPSEYVSVVSAIYTDANTVQVVFSDEFAVDAFSDSTKANIMVRLATVSNGIYKFTKVNGTHLQWGTIANLTPVDFDGDGKTNTWRYAANLGDGDVDILDLIAMTQAEGSVYKDYKVTIGFQELANNKVNINGANDAHIAVSGKYLAVNNHDNSAYYAPIRADLNELPKHFSVDGVELVSEDELKLKFTDVVVASMALVEMRILNADGTIAKAFPTQCVIQGDSFTVRLDTTNRVDNVSNFSDLWRYFTSNHSDGRLVVSVSQLGGGIDGVISTIKSVSGGHLLATVSNATVRDAAYVTITESDFTWNTEPFGVESAKQISANSLLIKFTDDIELKGMDEAAKPFISLRMVNEKGQLVRIVNGKPAVTGSGTYMQWASSDVRINGESKDELLVTWNYCDIGLLLSQSNMTYDLQQYDMVFSFQEAVVNQEFGNHLVHNLVRAKDGKQLDATFYVDKNNADSYLVYAKDIDLLGLQEELSVTDTEVIDQNRIVVTFSESVNLDKQLGIGYIRLVNQQLHTVLDENNVAMEWGGRLEYFDDAKTKVVFVLDFNNRNKDYPMTGLDDIVNAKLETDEYKLMFTIGDNKGNDGLIHAITSTTGKILPADPMNGGLDAIYLEFDKDAVPQGELTITDATVISDTQVIITFSDAIMIENTPFMSIRWYTEDNRMVWMTKDGEYVCSSTHNGEATTPMQWSYNWEYYNDEQTQIIGTISGGFQGLGNFTDFIRKDWEADVPGSRIVVGVEEKYESAVNGSWHVGNIKLKSDPRICLTANIVKGNYDGAYVEFAIDYTPNPITTSATVINDMQIKVTFSRPVNLIGNVFAAIRFVDEKGNLLYYGDEYNRIAVQFSGALVPIEGSKTQMIWTMSGNNNFGCCNISDVVNYRYALELLKGSKMQFCIEELTVKNVITVGGRNGLIDNLIGTDGRNHVKATKFSGYDSVWLDVNFSILKGKNGVELLSVKAIDEQTVELIFSEGIMITDPDHVSMAIRYLTPSGDSEVLTNGKLAQFKGDWEYKDENKNVILWKLNSKNAKSLTEIFNYEGNLKWNENARVAFCLKNDSEDIPGNTLRIIGITGLDGFSHLRAPLGEITEIQYDIEIAYDKPERVVESEVVESVPTKYVTNYIPFAIGGAAFLAVCVVVAVMISRKKEERT